MKASNGWASAKSNPAKFATNSGNVITQKSSMKDNKNHHGIKCKSKKKKY